MLDGWRDCSSRISRYSIVKEGIITMLMLYLGECKHYKCVDEREGAVDVRAVTIEQSEESTAENVRMAQQEDDIGPLLKWKVDNRPQPAWEDVSSESLTLKRYGPTGNLCE